MTNQILMAAARGARIQIRYLYYKPSDRLSVWRDVSGIVFDPANATFPHEQRVHPEDEHLRFGPVSTALRKFALRGARGRDLTFMAVNGVWWARHLDYAEYSCCRNDKQCSLFLLFLAEELAGEGL